MQRHMYGTFLILFVHGFGAERILKILRGLKFVISLLHICEKSDSGPILFDNLHIIFTLALFESIPVQYL
jgi:hypothetical protein